jgi:hypothetical protein
MESLKKFYYDSVHFVLIVMILIGFAFFFVGMIAVTLGLELLNRIYVHLGVRKFVHWVKPHLRLPS